MTRPTLILTALMLALMPIASAGPGATVDTLDDRGSRCAGDAWWWSDGNSSSDGGWFSSGGGQYSDCSSGYEYANVTVEDHRGEAARVTLHAENANHSRWSHASSHSWGSDWSTSSYGWSDAWGDAWSRGATADTRAGSASAAYGCRAQADDQHARWSWDSNHSSNEGWQSYGSGASRCGTTATALGDEAFVGQRCARESTSYGHTASWNGSSDRHDQHASGSQCTDGVATSAASAGTLSSCRSESYASSRQSAANETPAKWSWTGHTCEYGVYVLGPAGATFFAGVFESGSTFCEDESGCSGSASRAALARFGGEHNPLGPGETWVSIPLP